MLRFEGGRFGAVQLSQRHPNFRGARKHSNNAGEMTGLLKAIEAEMDLDRTDIFSLELTAEEDLSAIIGTKTIPPQ